MNPEDFSHDRQASIRQDRRPDPPAPVLAMPADTVIPESTTQSSINSLQENIRGLSETVMALASKMNDSTQASTSKRTDESTQNIVSTPVATKNTVLPVSSPCSTGTTEEPRKSENSRIVSQIPQDSEEMEVSSESGEDSGDEEHSSDDESVADSESNLRHAEGILDWPRLVSLIVEKFSDRIGPEDGQTTVNRIGNLGGLTEKKEGDRVRLPMFQPIIDELVAFSNDISNPQSKAKAKRDSKPLGRGSFPLSQRDLPIQALSDNLRFNHPAQIDSGVDKLLPSKKSSYVVQGRFSDDNLRTLERDLRVNLSSLSYVLWSLDFATQSMVELNEKSQDKEAFISIISACRHAMSFLSTVVDRSATSLATSILARRDSYLAQMDGVIPEEEMVTLRSSSLMDTTLFAGTVVDLIPKVESLRKESQSRESVDALASLAKKGVSSSSAKPSVSNPGSSKKKSTKKFSKKKSNGKKNFNASSGSSAKPATEQASSGNSGRSFRGKGKKQNNK